MNEAIYSAELSELVFLNPLTFQDDVFIEENKRNIKDYI